MCTIISTLAVDLDSQLVSHYITILIVEWEQGDAFCARTLLLNITEWWKKLPTTEASQIHIYGNVEDKNCDKHIVRSERINVELTLKLASRKSNCQSYCCGYIFSRLYYIGDIRWKFTPSTLVLWSPSCPLQILPNKQTWRTWASSPKSTVVQFIFDKQGTPTRGTEITYAI